MGISDRDYMKRDEKNYRIGDSSIHPSLRNLRFVKYGFSLIDLEEWFDDNDRTQIQES